LLPLDIITSVKATDLTHMSIESPKLSFLPPCGQVFY
jgi:hypothetical protein